MDDLSQFKQVDSQLCNCCRFELAAENYSVNMGDGTAVTLGNGADGTWPQDLGVSKALVRDDEKDRILRRGDLARILGL